MSTDRPSAPPETHALAHTPAVLALTYSTSNVGDDIQTLAMLQHAPLGAKVVWCDRDQLRGYRGESARLVANGWWAHGEQAWPPPTRVDVLPLSMHVQLQSRPHFGAVGFGERPVGARDTETLAWLRNAGVPSFFSACMTLTFPRSEHPRADKVVAVDLRGRDVPALRNALNGKADLMRVTHKIPRTTAPEERLRLARERLDLYAKAAMVVTSRLHAALPCIALGTPVLLVGHSNRFSGLAPFVPIARRVTPEALADAFRFEPQNLRETADALTQATKEFLAPCST